MKRNIFLYFALGMGIVGLLLLLFNFTYWLGIGKPSYSVLGKFSKIIYRISISYYSTPFFLGKFFSYLSGFAFLCFLFVSPIGIILGVKSLNSSSRKLAIFAIILNSINFLFALFIAWLLFGLARGM